MKIYTVTQHFHTAIKSLFAGVGEVNLLPTDYGRSENFSADLIIFTGGEDINPKRYGEFSRGYYNDSRDVWEMRVFNDIRKGRFPKTKVLGICRGLQLIAVGMGGGLYTDIQEFFGKSHSAVHGLTHKKKHPLDFLDRVNSMHHQAVRRVAGGEVLSVEPSTESPEIIRWGENTLGVQFHPEFMNDANPLKSRFTSAIVEWVKDLPKISINKERKPEEVEIKGIRYVSYREVPLTENPSINFSVTSTES